jgi:hypothetical protein
VSGLIARNRGVVGFAAFALAVAVIAVGGFGTARVVIAGVLAAIGVWAIWSSDDPIAAGADGSSVPDV